MTGTHSTLTPVPVSTLSAPTQAFLTREGVADAELVPFVADASARRYYRLAGAGILLMEDPQDPVGFSAYLRLSEHLRARGLSAPAVHAADVPQGLALVEDFGDQTYARCLKSGQDEVALYRLAIEALLHLHRDPQGAQVAQPTYDLDTHLQELTIFSDWFAPAVCPGLDVERFNARFLSLWADALSDVADRAETLVLRDFHIDNLMLLSDRKGVTRCGLLDFQDGILGPCEYDLVSLLQDARRDLAEGLEEEMLQLYIAGAPDELGGAAVIRQRYHLLGAQRHARILGVFVRLCQRDHKPRYLSFVPRVLRQFRTALNDAGLSGISAFLDSELPDWTERALSLDESLLVQQR